MSRITPISLKMALILLSACGPGALHGTNSPDAEQLIQLDRQIREEMAREAQSLEKLAAIGINARAQAQSGFIVPRTAAERLLFKSLKQQGSRNRR